jgi:hypothetical protein
VPHLRRNLITTGRLSEKQVAIIHVRVQCNANKLAVMHGGGRLLMSGSNKCGGLICGVFLHVTSITPTSTVHIAVADASSPTLYVTPSPSTLALRRQPPWSCQPSIRTLLERRVIARETVVGLPAFHKPHE